MKHSELAKPHYNWDLSNFLPKEMPPGTKGLGT